MPNASSSSAKVRYLDRDQATFALRELSASLAARVPMERVILFGSLARGDHSARSDADLLVVVPESPLPFMERAAPFLVHFADAPVPVDVLVWTSKEWQARLDRRDRFAARITSEGLVLWPAIK